MLTHSVIWALDKGPNKVLWVLSTARNLVQWTFSQEGVYFAMTYFIEMSSPLDMELLDSLCIAFVGCLVASIIKKHLLGLAQSNIHSSGIKFFRSIHLIFFIP